MSHRAIGPQFDPEGEPGFEDKGQGYFWPSTMPDSGTTVGNEGMHLYRGLNLSQDHTDPRAALHEVLHTPERTDVFDGAGTKEAGTVLGRHWSHDAEGLKNPDEYGSYNAILEADHPGRGAVMDWDKDRREAVATVFPYESREKAFPAEVPIRAGSDMNVRAIHLYNEGEDRWDRHEIEYRGKA